MDIKNFIEQIMSETSGLENIDLTEGTNLYDLLLLPLISVITKEMSLTVIDGAGDNLDLANYSDMEIDQLRTLATNHLISLHDQVSTSGEIILYFSGPVNYTIEADTTFKSGDTIFTVDGEYMISESLFNIASVNGSYQCALPIKVTSSEGVSIESNTLGYMSNAPSTLVKITHDAMYSGIEEYTNLDLYSKIKASVASNQSLSATGITRVINDNFGGLRRIVVVGAGDDDMNRDKIFNFGIEQNYSLLTAGFEGKVAGRDGSSDFNKNAAYALFSQDPTSSELVSTDGAEFTQAQYESVVVSADRVASVATDDIFSDTFTQSSAVSGRTAIITAIASTVINGEDYTTITLDDSSGIVAGDIINIKIYDAGDSPALLPTRTGVIREVTEAVITLYSDISLATPETGSYIETVVSEGLNLGNGWVSSEDNMPLGVKLNPREVMVVDDELVLGSTSIEYAGNPVLETIINLGVDKFLEAVNAGLAVEVNPVIAATNQTTSSFI